MESLKQCVCTVGRRDMTIADVESDLRVRIVDVSVILRTNTTTFVPYARSSTRKESARWNSLQHDTSVVCPDQACRDVAGTSREDAKLGRLPGWNLVRAERSSICVYAFVRGSWSTEAMTNKMIYIIHVIFPTVCVPFRV